MLNLAKKLLLVMSSNVCTPQQQFHHCLRASREQAPTVFGNARGAWAATSTNAEVFSVLASYTCMTFAVPVVFDVEYYMGRMLECS